MRLGMKVRDQITGFEGHVTGLVDYLSGCRQALVTPSVDEKGALRSAEWLDVQRLLDLGSSITIESATPGFDRAPPKR